MKTIPRPFKSPWVYAIAWKPGDSYIGRRWTVLNVSHNLEIASFSLEVEAKTYARGKKKEHEKAMAAARRAARGYTPPREPRSETIRKKSDEWLASKQGADFFNKIPFPA